MNLGEAGARAALLEGLKRERIKPLARPEFPGTGAKPRRYPGALPEVWEVPQPRDQNFTGRDQMLRNLHEALQSARPAAMAGLSGVRKTQLALEYAYRYASEYNLVWWLPEKVPASQPAGHHCGGAEVSGAQFRLAAGFRQRTKPGAVRGLPPAVELRPCFNHVAQPGVTGHGRAAGRTAAFPERGDSFLKKRTGRDEPNAALALSEAVGDLPIALEHAGAYIESTGASIQEYVELYGNYSKELLEPVQGTWSISLEKSKRCGVIR